jgi:uncharacterized protein (TIGR00369 family)
MKPEGLGAESVESIFYQANFIRDLNIRLDKISEGICETSLVVQERLLQQHGFIHGGVIATMADHTAGGAARSVSGDKDVLTVEFKINYLRPAIGDRLRCTASVLRAGKTVIVAESLVYASNAGKEALVAKLTETLFLADDPKARAGGAEWDSMLTRTRAKGKALNISSEADVERRSDEYRRDKKR